MKEPISITVRRSQLGRAKGAGAGGGVHHWYAERVTALALVPLTIWFIFAMWQLAGAPYGRVVEWARNPINAALMLALVVMTFHHTHLGLQVILEDYVDDVALRRIIVLAVQATCLLLGLMASVAVIKLAVS